MRSLQLNAVRLAAAQRPWAPRARGPSGAVHCQLHNPSVRASAIPTPDEDQEVMHSSFMKAFEAAKPQSLRIHGMQEFAGAILARQRIPSQQYSDPLAHIFTEVDRDGDGFITAHEVAQALRSRGVEISDDQAALFVDAVDPSQHRVSRAGWRELLLHMAAADLHSSRLEERQQQQQGGEPQEEEESWVQCSWESDEEVQTRLNAFIDRLRARDPKTPHL